MLAGLRLLLGLPWKLCIVFSHYTFLFFATGPLCLNPSVSWSSGVLKSIWKGTKPECFESTNQDTHTGLNVFSQKLKQIFFPENIIKENLGYLQRMVEPVNVQNCFCLIISISFFKPSEIQ